MSYKPKFNSITNYIFEDNKEIANLKWLNIKENNKWDFLSLDDFKNKIYQTASYLKKLGIKKGNLIGIISISSPQWLIFDQAIMMLGAVSVPLFPNASKENLNFILKQTNVKYVFCFGEEAFNNIVTFTNKLKKIFVYNLKKMKVARKITKTKLVDFSEVLKKGNVLLKNSKKNLGINLKKIKPQDLATIVYTSGSLGVPKGVMLTHENIMNQIDGCKEYFPINPMKDRTVTFLPFAHIFERAIIYYYLSIKVPIYFSPFLTQIGNIIREVKPTFMTTVPRLLHKIYERIYFNVKNSPKIKKFLAINAIRRAENKVIDSPTTVFDNLFEKLVYKKLREALGGELRCLVSGGAALDKTLYRFFYNIKIPLREGYGLTETSPVISANRMDKNQPYSVGLFFPNIKVKLSKEGEILTKSPSVMQGYYKNPALTKEAFTKDKWFKTGDIGRIENGFLFIESRKKELFKNISGKYITPVPLESALTKNPYVENALIIGDNKKFVTALLFLSEEHNAILSQEELKQEISKLISKINQKLNSWEKIIRFEMTSDVLSIEGGDLTPKMNIRREIVMKKYKSIIDAMYK